MATAKPGLARLIACSSTLLEAGCDEAGRGCLAGSVFAAAVILPPNFHCPELNDSKQLTEKMRYTLREQVQSQALAWSIGEATPAEIDEINILQASFLAMHRAIASLSIKPQLLLIDGNRFKPYPEIEHRCEIKGDARFLSIAAASVLAKTYRDDAMLALHTKYPMYDWKNNKGYPTVLHREGIRLYGVSPYHRKKFQLLPKNEQYGIDFPSV